MDHEDFMREALAEAQKAFDKEEVPIGAVIVRDGVIIGRGHNTTESEKDPTCHAEITAIKEAAKSLGGWRLLDCVMYVTAEPCSMCAGAIVLSRLPKLFVGAPNPKAGACGSVFNIVQEDRLNHQVDMECGLLSEESGAMLKSFFRKRLTEHK